MGDNWVLELVVTYYHIYDDFCKPGCIKGNLDWFGIDYLYKSIDDN